MRRYHIQERDDYKKYNKVAGMITKLVAQLRQLDARDAERIKLTDRLLTKCVGAFVLGVFFFCVVCECAAAWCAHASKPLSNTH